MPEFFGRKSREITQLPQTELEDLENLQEKLTELDTIVQSSEALIIDHLLELPDCVPYTLCQTIALCTYSEECVGKNATELAKKLKETWTQLDWQIEKAQDKLNSKL